MAGTFEKDGIYLRSHLCAHEFIISGKFCLCFCGCDLQLTPLLIRPIPSQLVLVPDLMPASHLDDAVAANDVTHVFQSSDLVPSSVPLTMLDGERRDTPHIPLQVFCHSDCWSEE